MYRDRRSLPPNAKGPSMATDHEMRMEALRLYEKNEKLRAEVEHLRENLNEIHRLSQVSNQDAWHTLDAIRVLAEYALKR